MQEKIQPFLWFFIMFVMLGVAHAESATESSNSVARVNGVPIPAERVDIRVRELTRQGQEDTPVLRKNIRDDLVNLELISQEAVKKGLDKSADVNQKIALARQSILDSALNQNSTPATVAQQLELARQSLLAGAFVQDYAKSHPLGDDVLKQEYEALKIRVGNKEYKIAHILVASEDEAKKVKVEVGKSDFATAAKAHSLDPGSKNKGGELGWAVPSNFVKPFGDALMKLNKGQISDPVQTQYGWHIIKLEDIRDLKVPSFEEMKPNLEKRKQQEAIQKVIEDLRSKARIE